MTESEWAKWQLKADALQKELHALITGAITPVLSKKDVINALKAATHNLEMKEKEDAR